MEPSWPRIAVLIPSYRRPQDLKRCLKAVYAQARPAQQIVVVLRTEDHESQQALAASGAAGVTLALVHAPGQIAALNQGLRVVQADVVAFTDDDAAPRPDWLERIAAHYRADSSLGGLGGRDWIHQHGRLENGAARAVGVVRWYGRCVGNHHLGVGPVREVDALKGVNMSFRMSALEGIRFDTRLRGTGAQVFNELAVCLAVKKRGWKLLYDPQLSVDHYPAVRHDEDKRNHFSATAIGNAAYNETLTWCEHSSQAKRMRILAWAVLVGNRAVPGLLNWVRLLLVERRTATRRFYAAIAGRYSGWADSRRR